MNTEWTLEQKEFGKSNEIGLMESLFTMGNGYLGLRGNFPLAGNFYEKGTFINGFYESGPITYGEKAYGFADNWQTIVPLPEGKEIVLQVDGYPVLPNRENLLNISRTLNLKESTTLWNFIAKDSIGRKYEGSVTIIIPFNRTGSVRFRWEIKLPADAKKVIIRSLLNSQLFEIKEKNDPRLPGHFDGKSLSYHFFNVKNENDLYALRAQGSRLTALCSMTNRTSGFIRSETKVQKINSGFEEVIIGEPRDRIVLEKTVSYNYGPTVSEDELVSQLLDELKRTSEKSTKELVEEQAQFMEKYWNDSDVKIEGDQEAQLSLRYNLFQLLQSTGRDPGRSIAAKGLSGSGYEGHYFWDAETYVLPFFVYTNKAIARSMLLYRISLIPSAAKRAKKLSHKGILFPWRTIGGEECSAYFPAGTAQYHINSDIALGLAKYLEVTGDSSILDEGGEALLVGTARFWCDFGTIVEGKGISYINVTGPDEYTALVDNNYYTNLSARENLKAAAKWLKGRVDEKERGLWMKQADQIYLPKEGSVTPQDDSFLQKEKWDFENTDLSSYPLLLNFHPLNIYRKQVLKQADVIMAQALFPSELSQEQQKRNFDYYEQITTRDSSLSACAQGICAFHLQYDDLAWEYFNETLHTDRKDLHKNVSQGLHTAAMGGSYLMIINGFLGFRIDSQGFLFKPALPNKLRGISLKLVLNDVSLSIQLKEKSVEYHALNGSLAFRHFDRQLNLKTGESVTIKLHERVNKNFTFYRPKV